MALANAAPVNTRAIKDVNYVVTVALPNAANTVNTNALNLIQAVPYPTTEYVIAQVTNAGNLGNGANNKNINVVLQHSADDNTSNYVNIPELANPLVMFVDNNGAGAPANYANVLLPPGVKKYIRAQATGEANGGDASNGKLTLQLLF